MKTYVCVLKLLKSHVFFQDIPGFVFQSNKIFGWADLLSFCLEQGLALNGETITSKKTLSTLIRNKFQPILQEDPLFTLHTTPHSYHQGRYKNNSNFSMF